MAREDLDGHQAPITRLSPEILVQIINYVDFASHVDFACTCKLIANCSWDILKRHQDAHRKYRNLSDLSPSAVPTLLRSAIELGDLIPVWHVRSFDIWGSRMCWAHWRPFELLGPIAFNESVDQLMWDYHGDKINAYLDPLRSRMSEDELETARGELEKGQDGFMKMLLISLCPRLCNLKFINTRERQKPSLSWLSQAISWYRSGEAWPQGFQALRDVSVGVPWMDAHLPRHPATALANILHLPNIGSVYYNSCSEGRIRDSDSDFNWDSDNEDDDDSTQDGAAKYGLEPGCSSVKHIFLDHFDDIGCEFSLTLAAAPRELLSMSFRHIDHLDDVDAIVNCLPPSVESLIFYNERGLNGYRCHSFLPNEIRFDVRHLSINISDVELGANGECLRDNGRDLDHDSFVEYFASQAFPKSLEVLILWGIMGLHMKKKRNAMDFLEDALIALIESEDYPDLKAVHLEDVETCIAKPRANRICFQKVIAAGERAGVDVYTITNRSPKKHVVQFPKAPDQFDIASGPYSGRRPSSWKFSANNGLWEPPGCESCGNCESCLSVYTKRLWQSIRPELK